MIEYMGGKTPQPSKKVHHAEPSQKQQLRMMLSTKTSSYLWYLIDNFSCKLNRFARYYENSIGKEYAKEYAHFGLPKTKHMLHIGCGAYPLTAIILAQTNNISQVVAIDNDQQAVKLAHNIITEKNLQKKITIEHSEGQNYPLKPFDVIIISSCSWPKLDIIEHVLENAKKNCIIILRELNHITPPVIQSISNHPNIKIIKQIRHQPFPFYGPFGWQSFYLKKT